MDHKLALAPDRTTTPNYVWRVLELFASYGTREAIVFDDTRRTYADLHASVFTLATALHGHGFRSGMSAAILLYNPPEAAALQLALHLLGCRTAWISGLDMSKRQRQEFLRTAEVDALIYDVRRRAEMGREIADADPHLPVFCLGPDGLGPDLLAAPRATTAPVDPADVPDLPDTLCQTGGTTGQPKLVHHRQRFFETVLLLSEQYLAQGQHPLRHATFFGYGHVAGQLPSLMTLFTGGTLFVHEGISFERIIRQIEAERVNSMLLFPALLYMMLDHPLLAETDTSSLRTVSCSGAPTAPARMAQAIARFGTAMRPTYGMTEVPFITALPNLTAEPDRPDRLGSCGYPYGDIHIEIRDEGGGIRAAREVGEVWVTGGLVMAGYWGQPELTRETVVGGWLRTGDIGFVDEDGYLFLVDRRKDMIITGYGATNVYCRPIEDILAGHPGVRAAAVIGVPDDAFGEVAYAYVVAHDGATVTEADLCERVRTEFDERWTPRGVEFVDSLPLTDIGKVDKKALRARHRVDTSHPGASRPGG